MNIWIFRSNKHILLKNSFAIHIMEDTSVQSACPISATRTLVSPLEKIPLSKWQTLSRKNASRCKFTKRFRERERGADRKPVHKEFIKIHGGALLLCRDTRVVEHRLQPPLSSSHDPTLRGNRYSITDCFRAEADKSCTRSKRLRVEEVRKMVVVLATK